MLRFGLCCIFVDEPIRFRQTTAKALMKLPMAERHKKISRLCQENAQALIKAVTTVDALGIGAFRVLSPLLPRYTHPDVGYSLEELPQAEAIIAAFRKVNQLRQERNIRLSFHPDQFVLLSSPNAEVIRKSVAELDYQAMVAEMIGADVINIHGGGVYGNKADALLRLSNHVRDLPERIQCRLTLENDDISYTVEDLLPVCNDLSLPLVYDVHHHRCNPDCLTVAKATRLCLRTWHNCDRGEAYLHLSSPRQGWSVKNPRPHAEYININDFPVEWLGLNATIDIEAKAKERAVLAIMRDLDRTTL